MELSRTKKFKIALAVAGMTTVDFGIIHGVTRSMVNQVLRGDAISKRIDTEINKFINTELKKLGILN